MQLHASCVAFRGQGVLIRGQSGSGKSGLALGLIAFGADLVADDRTIIRAQDGWPMASAPSSIAGLIEAWGIGILRVATARAPARLRLVVDMDNCETSRHPPERHTDIFGAQLPLLHKVESPYFAAAIRQYLISGRADL